jgi:hypothetical protein
MPGRDNFQWLDYLGYLALIGAFAGVLLHALLRCVTVCFGKGAKHE